MASVSRPTVDSYAARKPYSTVVLPPITDPVALLGPDTTALRLEPATVTALTAAGISAFPAVVGPVGDPALAGRYDVITGRAAGASGEAMATASALNLEHMCAQGRFREADESMVEVIAAIDELKPLFQEQLDRARRC